MLSLLFRIVHYHIVFEQYLPQILSKLNKIWSHIPKLTKVSKFSLLLCLIFFLEIKFPLPLSQLLSKIFSLNTTTPRRPNSLPSPRLVSSCFEFIRLLAPLSNFLYGGTRSHPFCFPGVWHKLVSQ